jgi:hypothetical protein
MANEEGIKIPIIAEDRFTETIKKIDAYTKIFGETASNTEKKLAALEKEMVRLVANGMDPANQKIVEMKANYDKLNQSLNNGNGSLKDANKRWMSLSLVVQDLPYGFRGIQNNLPALFGSLATGAGAGYFAFSALVAAVTFFDQSLQKTNTTAKELFETFNTLKTETLAIGSIFSAVRAGTLSAADATKIFNDKLGDLYGTAKSVYEAEQLYIKKTEGYIKAQYFRAKADIEYEKAKEALAKKDVAYAEDQIGILGKLAMATAAFFKGGAFQGVGGLYSTSTVLAKDFSDLQIELAGYVTDSEEAQFQKRLALGERYMSQAYKIEQEYGIKSNGVKDKTDKAALAALGKAIEQQQRVNEQVIQNLIDAKKQEVKLYEDDAYAKYEASRQLIELEKKLALEKLNNAGYTAKQVAALELGIYIERDNKIVLLGEALQEQLLGQDAKTRKEKKRRDEEDYKNQEKFGKGQIDLIDSQLKVQLKLNKDNVIGQQEVITQSMAKVGALMASSFGTGMFPTYLKFYDELNAKLQGLDQNALRGADAMKKVNSIISDTATNAIVQFGENLGKAFAGENVDIFGGFLDLLAGGLQAIGSALIAYGFAMDAFKKAFNDPYLAIAAGVALVAAGAFLKSKISKVSSTGGGASTGNIPAFANGGIISGPTMGLMGEYPGAKSNPEVVAPLDKLKDMLGGGQSGTFLLRGQDLLLSVNRAQKASNLKGQTISLV